jgi:hypothetical protein
MKRNILLLGILCLPMGCSFMARGPADYKKDTRQVIETKNEDIKACYDAALEDNSTTSGMVVAHFTVEKETGVFKDVAIDEKESKAPESLKACIKENIEGLVLKPEDERDGKATFVWQFDAPPAAAEEKPAG